MTLRITGDEDASYLVADAANDDGEVEVVQLAKFESEKARRIFEAELERLRDPWELRA